MARGKPLVRQWNLLKTLQAHRFGVSTSDLAERLACSKRQVQRDIGVLRQVGFPVEHEDREFGKRFWRLAPHFLEREELVLSLTEMVSLYLARQMLSPLAGTALGDGLATSIEKIKALVPRDALAYFGDLDETIFVKSVAQPDYSGQEKEIRILNRAVADCRALKVRYHSASKDREWEADVHPYGLVYFGTNLYVVGHLVQYAEVRTLKVSRIRGVQMTDRRFERPDDFSLAAYLDGSFGIFSPGPLQTIDVRFTGWAATSVREHRWHPSQAILKDTRAGVVARFNLTDTRELKRWVLGYGAGAVVLKPKALAEEMREDLCAACDNYPPGEGQSCRT